MRLRHVVAASVLAAVCAAPAAADGPRTFDLTSFTPPAGWRLAAESAGQVKYERVDQAAGTWVMLGLYASRSASGDAAESFQTEWAEVVQANFAAPDAPASVQGKTAAGLAFRRAEADVATSVGPARVEFTVLFSGGRLVTVLVAASNRAALEATRREHRATLDGLRLLAPGATAVPPPAAPPPPADVPPAAPSSIPEAGEARPPRDPVQWRGSGIVGVWMAMSARVFGNPGSPATSPHWYTFFAGGDAFLDLPSTGLLAFDRAASRAGPRADAWAPYKMSGATGSFTRPGSRYSTNLEVLGKDTLKIDGITYNRSVDVTGVRLEGAWTTYANPTDPDLDRLPVGERPLIHFTKGGQFRDDGIFATILRSGFGPEHQRFDAPGEGTYEVRDFTLVLRSSDGRVRRVAFSGFLGGDPRTSDAIVCLHRTLVRKRPGR